jgi:hypothetical protein
MSDQKPESKPSVIALTERDLEILRYVSKFRIVTMEDLFKQFFRGLTVAAAKSTLRRLRGRKGGNRYIRPQKISAKRVGYVLTRLGCLTLGVPTKRCRSVGQKSIIAKLSIAEYLGASPTRELIRGKALREMLKFEGEHQGKQVPMGVAVVGDIAEGKERLQLVFVHFGGYPLGFARRTATVVNTYFGKKWFLVDLAARTLDIVVLTGMAGIVPALKKQLQEAIGTLLYVRVRNIHGEVSPLSVIGLHVQAVKCLHGVVITRSNPQKRGNER